MKGEQRRKCPSFLFSFNFFFPLCILPLLFFFYTKPTERSEKRGRIIERNWERPRERERERFRDWSRGREPGWDPMNPDPRPWVSTNGRPEARFPVGRRRTNSVVRQSRGATSGGSLAGWARGDFRRFWPKSGDFQGRFSGEISGATWDTISGEPSLFFPAISVGLTRWISLCLNRKSLGNFLWFGSIKLVYYCWFGLGFWLD
jgi:hypothetical protein